MSRTYHNGILTKTLMVPVFHYWIPIKGDNVWRITDLNRKIRDWCGQNLPDSCWETKLEHATINNHIQTVVGVYIDLEYPEAVMAVKLAWT